MRMSRSVCLLVVLGLAVASCSHPGEAQAMETLSATETAMIPLIEAAVGPGAVTEWERLDAFVSDWFCSDCVGVTSRMELAGIFPEETLERFRSAASLAGARSGPVERSTVGSYVVGSYCVVSFDDELFDVRVQWDPDTGKLVIATGTGPFVPGT